MVDVQRELEFSSPQEQTGSDAEAAAIASDAIADNLADVDGRRRDTEAGEPANSAEWAEARGKYSDLKYELEVDTRLHPSADASERKLSPEVKAIGREGISAVRETLVQIKRKTQQEEADRADSSPQVRGADVIAEAADINDAKERQKAKDFAEWAKDKKRFEANH